MTDLYGSIKILVVLTSAIFAIAQYYENRQKKLIDTGKQATENIEFEGADKSPEILGYKNKWDIIQIKKPLNNEQIIYILWGLILFYVLSLPFIFGVSVLPESFKSFSTFVVYIIRFSFIVAALVLIYASAMLSDSLYNMKKQLTSFQNDVEKVKEYNALKKTLQQLRLV